MFEFVEENLITCAIVFVLFAVYYWKNGRIFYYGSKFDGPFALPLIGNALVFIGDDKTVFNRNLRLWQKYKSPWRLYLGIDLYVMILKPEHLETILNSPHALNKGQSYKLMECLFGQSLFTAKANRWKQNKKLIAPAFNPKILKDFVGVFAEKSSELVASLEKYVGTTEYFNVTPEVIKCALKMTCETNLGLKANEQDMVNVYINNLETLTNIAAKRMYSVWLQPEFLFKMSSLSRIFKKMLSEVFEIIVEIIEKKKDALKEKSWECDESGPNFKPFLERLMEISEKGRMKFTNEEMVYEVNTITAAGSGTSAGTISFLLVLLGMHQDVQEEVYKEIQKIFEKSDRAVTYDDLPKMEVLERVIKETMRLFPPAVVFLRSISEDIVLDSRVIPRGSTVSISPLIAHRNPEVWENPLKFDPDRFLPENVQKRHLYSFIPFSAGPRSCIGQKYAMYAMKVMAATVLRKYKVSATSYKTVEDIELKMDISARTCHGCNIKLERRV